jgi:hypothetical protein
MGEDVIGYAGKGCEGGGGREREDVMGLIWRDEGGLPQTAMSSVPGMRERLSGAAPRTCPGSVTVSYLLLESIACVGDG